MQYIINNGMRGTMVQYWTGEGWSNQTDRAAAKRYDSAEQVAEVCEELGSNYPELTRINVQEVR